MNCSRFMLILSDDWTYLELMAAKTFPTIPKGYKSWLYIRPNTWEVRYYLVHIYTYIRLMSVWVVWVSPRDLWGGKRTLGQTHLVAVSTPWGLQAISPNHYTSHRLGQIWASGGLYCYLNNNRNQTPPFQATSLTLFIFFKFFSIWG